MKRVVLIILATALFASSQAQRDTVTITARTARSEAPATMADQAALKIYPVPVKDNNFTITSEREITLIKITNIIGQEIYRNKQSIPVLTTRVFLDAPQRGMYLVTVYFSDNSRAVRKIMVEGM
jgi:CBS domain-containing protein